MASVLDMHGRADKAFAPRRDEATKFVWQIKGMRGRLYMKGSLEQNQAKIDGYFETAADIIARDLST